MVDCLLETVFKEQNLNIAMENLLSKNDSCGTDGLRISEFPNYWRLNHEEIIESVLAGSYLPGTVQNLEILSKSGKRRMISKLNTIDRFLLRALYQVLQPDFEKVFCANSFAFIDAKGVIAAVEQAQKYIALATRSFTS
jgi:retron-type reverse transcriptase